MRCSIGWLGAAVLAGLFAALHEPARADDDGRCSSGATLDVRISGFDSTRGVAAVALFDSSAAHTERRPVRSATLPIEQGEATWRVADLHCGTYSILAYHDENDNGSLDTRALGLPKEKYGASNDARSLLGPPTFADARFELTVEGAELEIRVR